MDDRVLTTLADGVLEVRINRPEKKNALTRAMYDGLSEALVRADREAVVKVVVLTGTGDSFSSGNDIADFAPMTAGREKPSLRFLRVISGAQKPIVAGVNGLAVGVGVTMLLHCDLVYAADTATFQMPFVDLGLVPEAGSSLLLPLLVGHQRASELFLLGTRFDARRAHELGLVNRVLAGDALADEVRRVALAIAAKPGAPVRLTKALLKGAHRAVSERIAEEAALFDQQLRSPEAAEAIAAFKERRKPDFSKMA